LEVFGLQASLDEARIFEDDYGIEGMSTVKGLRLINQGAVPGIAVRKVTSANISTIDALNIATSTKTTLKDAVRLGHVVYVPTAQFTYGTWTGLVYIDLDPATGAGGYIIGEGLNGGYTTGTFLDDIARFLREKLIDGVSATIMQPTAGQQFTKGTKIHWKIQYNGTLRWVPAIPVNWTEEGDLNTSSYDVGTLRLTPGYGVGTSVAVTLVYQTRLGTAYNLYDEVIIEHADQYGIPRDLLKSMIHQEAYKKFDEQLGQKVFITRSYRYEAHKDYDWYSRQSPAIPPELGWRGLGNHPEKHFALAGHVVTGQAIPRGDQVSFGYCYWSEYTGAGPLNFPATGCAGVTAADLVSLNPNQRWPGRPNWNFTAQLILAASYGLTQTLYETAVNRGFDTRADGGQSAQPVEKLFEPDVSVALGARELKKQYNIYGDWWNALKFYNGGFVSIDPTVRDSEDYADAVVDIWKNGNGIYKPI